MSGNRTTELKTLSKLKIAGRLRYLLGTIEIPEAELHAICDEIQAEHEQAIAATLGSEPPYDELLRCLENDWNISVSWDGLRRFWHIGLTEEGVRLRDAEMNSRAVWTCECIMCAYFENKSTCGAYCNYFDRELGDDYNGGCTWGVLSGCKVVGE